MREGKLYQSFRVRLLRDFLTHEGSLVNYLTWEQKVSYLKKKKNPCDCYPAKLKKSWRTFFYSTLNHNVCYSVLD